VRGNGALRERRVADALAAHGTEDARRGDQRRAEHHCGEDSLSEHAFIVGVPRLGVAPRCAAVGLPDPGHSIRRPQALRRS